MDPPNEDDDSNTLFHYSSDSCAASRLHFLEESWIWVNCGTNISYMQQKRKRKTRMMHQKGAHSGEHVKRLLEKRKKEIWKD